MDLAPIVLFAFNRPEHLKRTVESLASNVFAKESDLVVFCDGPRTEAEQATTNLVRQYARTILGFNSLVVVDRDRNWGLAPSVIEGVSQIVRKYGRVIVLEDDMITNRDFLSYMNGCLELYKNEDKVISISGYIYPVAAALPETFFLRGADCWGWATWKRGWDLFDADGLNLLTTIKARQLQCEFNFNNSYPYVNMLERQVLGKNSSWAIRWYASAFIKDKLTLYPGKSLVQNIGMDGTGTHCSETTHFTEADVLSHRRIALHRVAIGHNDAAYDQICSYFAARKKSLMHRAMDKIVALAMQMNTRLRRLIRGALCH